MAAPSWTRTPVPTTAKRLAKTQPENTHNGNTWSGRTRRLLFGHAMWKFDGGCDKVDWEENGYEETWINISSNLIKKV